MKVLPLSCKKKNVLKKHFVYKYKDTLKILRVLFLKKLENQNMRYLSCEVVGILHKAQQIAESLYA